MYSEQDKSLEDILSINGIQMPQMFKIPRIFEKIKNKLQMFIDFCLNNEDFIKTMINFSIKVPMHDNQNMKQIAHIALQILTLDHDCIVQLFIIDKKRQRIRFYSQDDEEICQVIVKDQQSGQLMIENPKPKKQLSFYQKFKNLLQMMTYISQKIQNIDENCINYLMKVLNTIVRVKPQQVYKFFQGMPSLLNNLINLTCFPSVCYFFAKLLNQIDSDKYRKNKLDIVYKYIQKLKQQINSDSFMCRMQLVQEIFNKNKFRNDDVDEIKIISQPFVDANIIQWFVKKIVNHQQNKLQFQNSIYYLLTVVKRMNVDEEKDPFNYYQQNDQKPTMDFHISTLYQFFPQLIQLASNIQDNNKYQNIWSNLSIFNLYELLLSMTKHSKFLNYTNKLKYNQVFILLSNYNRESSKGKKGMILSYKVSLIQRIIQQINNNNIQQTLQQQENIRKQLKILNNSVTFSQKKGFDNKLKVLLQINGTNWNQIQIYNIQIVPNSFTQKKKNLVPQFEFLKKIPKVQEHRNGQSKINRFQQNKQSQQQQQEQTKPSLNLPKLDDRIQKMKKRKKTEEILQQVKKNQEVKQNKQKQKQYRLNPQQVGFFSRHLIIF